MYISLLVARGISSVRSELKNCELRSMMHATGSTSMLPKDEGGVVDEKLKVYGTRNLRVVCCGLSVFLIAQ